MLDIDNIIKINGYVGIRTEEGQEFLENQVLANHSPYIAAQVLDRLTDSDFDYA